MASLPTRVWNSWLPPAIAQQITAEEPARFAALVRGFEEDVHNAEEDGRWHAVLRWVPLINNFLATKSEYDVAVVQRLAQSLLTVVLNTKNDLETQVRCASTLIDLIRSYKRNLKWTVDWRPLYELLQDLFGRPMPRLQVQLRPFSAV